MARDFDLGITGPPLSIAMDFIASGLVEMVGGIASAIVLVRLRVVGAAPARRRVGSTHWLLRESAVWRDRNTDEVRDAQRHADYAYRLAVDAARGEGAAAVRARRAGWSSGSRRAASGCTSCSGRRRGCASARCIGCLAIVLGANLVVFWALAERGLRRPARPRGRGRVPADRGRHERDRVRRPELGARRRRGAGRRGRAGSRPRWSPSARSSDGTATRRRPARARDPVPRRDVRLRDQLAPGARRTSTSPSRPARRWRSSVRTAPARPRSPSCCAASTTRSRARSRSTASTSASSSSTTWRSRVTAVFQDFVRFELPLRDNVAPARRARRRHRRPRSPTRARPTSPTLDTILARGYEGGTDLSGGQWQRVALGARAVRGAARRGCRAARRADRAARRARRGRDLRADPRRDPRHARRS